MFSFAFRTGIIPACAGSTEAGTATPEPPRDHPGMRREHHPASIARAVGWGSSRHAPGAQLMEHLENDHFGIIPACAGSTEELFHFAFTSRDHPGMRREHVPADHRLHSDRGSSRHAPGARSGHDHGIAVHGIIPACAGSTIRRFSSRGRARDHPGMRREHVTASIPLSPS